MFIKFYGLLFRRDVTAPDTHSVSMKRGPDDLADVHTATTAETEVEKVSEAFSDTRYKSRFCTTRLIVPSFRFPRKNSHRC